MRTLMIIGAGYYQLPLIKSTKSKGIKTVVVDGDKNAVGRYESDIFINVDIRNPQAVLRIAQDEKIDGITSLSVEAAVQTVSYVCDKLSLSGIKQETALSATNKTLMRNKFYEQGIKLPKYKSFTSYSGVEQFVKSIGLPVIVKPSDSSGSRGVQRIENISHLDDAFNYSKSNSISGEVLVEEFINGPEVSVEMFTHKGKHHVLATSEKRRTPPPYQLDTHVIFPCQLVDEQIDAIINMARKMADAVGIDFGPSHSELIITPKGPVPVEIAARGAGFKVYSDILPLITGIDTIGLLIDISLGDDIYIEKLYKKSAILGFLKSPTGILRQIEGFETISSLKGVHEINIFRKKGDLIKPLLSGADRDGYYIICHDDINDCFDTSQMIHDNIFFEVDKYES